MIGACAPAPSPVRVNTRKEARPGDGALVAGAATPGNGGEVMPRYVALIDWTEQGVRNFRDTVDRYEAARELLEGLGVQFTDVYWTLGSHDIVAVLDAPDDETLSAGLLATAGAGNIRTTTLRAFSADEMRSVIGKVA
jgi:uncharacterized protein with GYD domain